MTPSRKWAAARITALTAFTIAWIEAGTWNTTLAVMAVGIISEAAIAYLTPNTPPPPQ